MILSQVEMGNLFDPLSNKNITHFQSIGVEAWITSESLMIPNSFHVLQGAPGFTVRKKMILKGLQIMLQKILAHSFSMLK